MWSKAFWQDNLRVADRQQIADFGILRSFKFGFRNADFDQKRSSLADRILLTFTRKIGGSGGFGEALSIDTVRLEYWADRGRMVHHVTTLLNEFF